MAPSQIPRSTWHPTYPPLPDPHQPPKQRLVRAAHPQAHRKFRPPIDLQHQHWLHRTLDQFNQLILFGESQPSNGTVRKVDRLDGETCFAVAYGDAPDDDLRALLVCPLNLINTL